MRLLALDPLREDVHRLLMRLHARAGRRNAALRQYRACADALGRDLGVAPEDETTGLWGGEGEESARLIEPREPTAMVPDTVIFRDLAYVFLAAVIGGAVAWLARQPLILGYVAGGIVIGPFTPGPALSDVHTFEVVAEIGVVLLMFSIGIEFSLSDLLRVKWVALLGGPLGIVLSRGSAWAWARSSAGRPCRGSSSASSCRWRARWCWRGSSSTAASCTRPTAA